MDTTLGNLARMGGASPWLLVLLGVMVFIVIFILLLVFFPSGGRLEQRRESLGLNRFEPETQPVLTLTGVGPTTSWDRFAAVFLPRTEKARAMNTERIKLAGYRSLTALATYYTARLGLMLLLPPLVYVVAHLYTGWLLTDLAPYVMGAFMIGMIGPSYYLDRQVQRRQKVLRNALPDALDLLVVCTESGLGLNAALVRVARELKDIHPEFAVELALVNAELRAGLNRDQSLRNLVDRTGLDDIKALVVLLIQSLRFGTSIAESLRTYAEEFRDKRMQRAEELAAQLGTKMIFPLILCFMPAFFITAIGPSVLGIIKSI